MCDCMHCGSDWHNSAKCPKQQASEDETPQASPQPVELFIGVDLYGAPDPRYTPPPGWRPVAVHG